MTKNSTSSDDIAIRKPPVGAVFAQWLPRVPGKCDWCGEKQDERTPVRKQFKLRHAKCDREQAIIQSPEQARHAVFERDHGICFDCGEDWSEKYRYLPRRMGGVVYVELGFAVEHPSHPFGYYIATHSRWSSVKREDAYEFVEIRPVSLWHVDHRVPLWKVRHMPALKRIEYFKLANMVTRCEPARHPDPIR